MALSGIEGRAKRRRKQEAISIRHAAGLTCAVLLLGGCAGPKVTYQRAEALNATSLRSAASTSFLFRVPRSQILINPAGNEKRIHAAVLNPVPTADWGVLPYNPGIYYRVSVTQETAGTLSMAEFRASFGKTLKVFPVPSCRTARVEIGVAEDSELNAAFRKEPLKLKLQAVATEYDYPTDDESLSLSPLYWAKPKRGWFSATRLNVVSYPNTYLVKTIGVEVQDHFAEAITVLAGIAKTAIGPVKGIPEPPEKFVTVFSSAITVADNRRIAVAPLPKKGKISLHPICGADISEQGDLTSLESLKNAQTAIAKAKELYEVWNRRRP